MTDEPSSGVGRRRFFRAVATGVVEAAGTAIGAAEELQQASIRAASAMLNPEPHAVPELARVRPPFRVQDGVLLVVDENWLPDEVVEIECRSPVDLAREIARGALPGGSAAGEAAALSLALAAGEMRTYEPTLRRAILEVRASALVNARPASQHLRGAVTRVMRRELADSGPAMRSEAEAIGAEAAEASRRIAERLVELLSVVTDRPVAVLTHGSGAPLPAFPAHEVRVLLADVAAGWLLASGRVDAVLVAAERVALNGDVTNAIGTYSLAILAAHHGVPFYVCAPLAALDADTEGGMPNSIDGRDGADLAIPSHDITPHELVTAIVTEVGVLRPPFANALTAATRIT